MLLYWVVVEILTDQTTLESDKVKFFALNYVIAISYLDAVWLSDLQEGMLFSEGKFTQVLVRSFDRRVIFIKTVTTTAQKWKEIFFTEDKRSVPGRNVTKTR